VMLRSPVCIHSLLLNTTPVATTTTNATRDPSLSERS
jgi:hypothetical protein